MSTYPKKKVYIAGPIKGIADKNEYLFRAAEGYFKSFGFDVVVPLDISPYEHEGLCPGNTSDAGESNVHKAGCFMRNDIIEMLKCDFIAMLRGWEHAAGARVEFLTAQACGIEIISLDFHIELAV